MHGHAWTGSSCLPIFIQKLLAEMCIPFASVRKCEHWATSFACSTAHSGARKYAHRPQWRHPVGNPKTAISYSTAPTMERGRGIGAGQAGLSFNKGQFIERRRIKSSASHWSLMRGYQFSVRKHTHTHWAGRCALQIASCQLRIEICQLLHRFCQFCICAAVR